MVGSCQCNRTACICTADGSVEYRTIYGTPDAYNTVNITVKYTATCPMCKAEKLFYEICLFGVCKECHGYPPNYMTGIDNGETPVDV